MVILLSYGPNMKILIACERSGKVREAFRKLGHDAWSCDIVPADDGSEYHIQCDAIESAYGQHWDMMIAHPPCTYLSNSGVRWLYVNGRIDAMRWSGLQLATIFFNQLKDAPIHRICIENPIPHKHAKKIIDDYDQLIQPWQFGHSESKATCLWLKNLPPLTPTNIVSGREGRIWKLPPGPERQRIRSETYQGIADAMAGQWWQCT